MGNTRCSSIIAIGRGNNCQPILHMSKILVHIYSTDDFINQFSIGFIINPSLHVNKMFIEQFEKFSNATFNEKKM